MYHRPARWNIFLYNMRCRYCVQILRYWPFGIIEDKKIQMMESREVSVAVRLRVSNKSSLSLAQQLVRYESFYQGQL
ncbi:hypothetical protein M404DRAFT_515969 [Pisolithus tinctorius Marx 270]|uniref:Uncharacterized protein n=1 Tax=Pisolithus tinctorius Marx 270 TaxID=870435 RepID=A0A0C3NCQ1_PISTI|nr:hypothetical protein M404DRAFT_515969 [Pisolithus tinctorius Marx 270]